MSGYHPRGAAVDLWKCKAPEVLICGSAGTGKSRAMLEKAVAMALKYPHARILLVRKTRASMTETTLVTLESSVMVSDNGEPLPWVGSMLRRTRNAYVLPNGSEIAVMGMDNPERIMSSEFDAAFVCEATELTEHEFEMITTRLRNGKIPYQQAACDCNPASPSHWLRRRCDSGRMVYLQSTHQDNLRLWKDGDWTDEGKAYRARLANLTGHRRERLYLGRWAAAEGLVYPEWDESVHLLDAMPAGWEAWPKYRAIDFGFTNPFVCQWWAKDPDGRLYLYREIYKTQRTVADHAADITRLSAGETYPATIADHDAEDRATLLAAGIPTIAANKAVTVGIQRVSERLRKQADGKPRIFILRNALVEADPLLIESKKPYCTAQEMDCYVWPKGSDGKSMKEEPVKEHDHGCDPMRYISMYFDSPGPSSFGVMAGGTQSKQLVGGTVSTGGSFAAMSGSRWDRGWHKLV